jgi:hypothetical protein
MDALAATRAVLETGCMVPACVPPEVKLSIVGRNAAAAVTGEVG